MLEPTCEPLPLGPFYGFQQDVCVWWNAFSSPHPRYPAGKSTVGLLQGFLSEQLASMPDHVLMLQPAQQVCDVLRGADR